MEAISNGLIVCLVQSSRRIRSRLLQHRILTSIDFNCTARHCVWMCCSSAFLFITAHSHSLIILSVLLVNLQLAQQQVAKVMQQSAWQHRHPELWWMSFYSCSDCSKLNIVRNCPFILLQCTVISLNHICLTALFLFSCSLFLKQAVH